PLKPYGVRVCGRCRKPLGDTIHPFASEPKPGCDPVTNTFCIESNDFAVLAQRLVRAGVQVGQLGANRLDRQGRIGCGLALHRQQIRCDADGGHHGDALDALGVRAVLDA
ncbi:pentatricopeptide repeat-containing protein, partial [Corchorus olitorius]